MTAPRNPLPVLGWREWVALPQLGIGRIKAKIDTGARSSAIHAFEVETFRRGGKELVRFVLHPRQRSVVPAMHAEAEVVDYRTVRASSGHETTRPVILTEVQVLKQRWTIELTLAARDAMGFRMLLGRQAIRGRFLVDAGHSYRGQRS